MYRFEDIERKFELEKKENLSERIKPSFYLTGYEGVQNYSELKAYLDGCDETYRTLQSLLTIFSNEFSGCDKASTFRMLDVGCSDGELSIPLYKEIRKIIGNLNVTAIEPEADAIKKFDEKIKGMSFLKSRNITVQEYIKQAGKEIEMFNFILFAQCWYHFPKDDWDFILNEAFRRLHDNGLLVILLDSHRGPAYKLKYLITTGKADTLEFGDLFSAEDVENLLIRNRAKFDVVTFPIYVEVNDQGRKVEDFARHLSFLYRTYPEKLLSRFKNEIIEYMNECKKSNCYVLENIVKMIIVAK